MYRMASKFRHLFSQSLGLPLPLRETCPNLVSGPLLAQMSATMPVDASVSASPGGRRRGAGHAGQLESGAPRDARRVAGKAERSGERQPDRLLRPGRGCNPVNGKAGVYRADRSEAECAGGPGCCDADREGHCDPPTDPHHPMGQRPVYPPASPATPPRRGLGPERRHDQDDLAGLGPATFRGVARFGEGRPAGAALKWTIRFAATAWCHEAGRVGRRCRGASRERFPRPLHGRFRHLISKLAMRDTITATGASDVSVPEPGPG